jgi:hypothetical protein
MSAPASAVEEMGSLNAAQDALNRMRRASERGTGCHLTADMIAALTCSIVGQMWGEDDSRALLKDQKQ